MSGKKDKRRLEDQAIQSQKMEAVGRLADGVAHEFNNILTSILGYAEMILQPLEEGDPLRDDVEEIKKAAERGAYLIQQLLALGRSQIIEPKVINLNSFLSESELMLGRIIGEDIELEFKPGEDIWNIRADPHHLNLILINLAANARDAMPHGGKLILETQNVSIDGEFAKVDPGLAQGDHVVLAVSDSGLGLDEDTISHIFEPFYASSNRDLGSGLGLSAVYGVVKQNNGHIRVLSKPGAGSSFRIYLPAVRESVAVKQEAGAKPTSTGSETILLVEDDDMVRKLARKILAMQGYEVLEASGAGEAYLICQEHSEGIDLLLTDVIMPNMNGKELYEYLKTTAPMLRVLYMSGYAESVIADRHVLNGEADIIRKPFTIEDLAAKVREILDR